MMRWLTAIYFLLCVAAYADTPPTLFQPVSTVDQTNAVVARQSLAQPKERQPNNLPKNPSYQNLKAIPILVGLYVNNHDVGSHIIYQTDNTYWVPWSLIKQLLGLKDNGLTEGILSYPTTLGTITFNSNDFVQVGIGYSNNEVGFTASWHKYINAGLRFTIRYSNNMGPASYLEDENDSFDRDYEGEQTLAFSLWWNLAWSQSRFVPADRAAISHTRGGIAGSLALMDESSFKPSDINEVGLIVNGKYRAHRQVDGTFFIGNLLPGIYTVSVDPEKLPFGLVVDQSTLTVEVAGGVVTEVNFPIHAEYGVMGKVVDHNGNGLANVTVQVSDDSGKNRAEVTTNMFGYYRIDGLRPGTHQVMVISRHHEEQAAVSQSQITISGDYLLDVNLILPNGS